VVTNAINDLIDVCIEETQRHLVGVAAVLAKQTPHLA
jgi:hypothetical protein